MKKEAKRPPLVLSMWALHYINLREGVLEASFQPLQRDALQDSDITE